MGNDRKIDNIINSVINGDTESFSIIYEMLEKFFNENYTSYSYIPETIYKEITHDILYTFIINGKLPKADFFKSFKLDFNKLMNSKLADYIIQNPVIINNYLSGIKEKDQLFDEFCKFLKKVKYTENVDNMIYILNTSSLLMETIKNMMGNISEIKESSLNNFSKYPISVHILEVYCLINDIEIIEELDQVDEKYNQDMLDYVSDSYNTYLKDIRNLNLPILSKEEEYELAKRYSEGDSDAGNQLVLHNLRFVIKFAFKNVNKGLPVADLIQEGNVGLIRAVQTFDYKKGFRFTTYASFWIKAKIQRALSNNSRSVRVPVHVLEKVDKIKKVMDDYYEKNGVPITNEELSEIVNIPVKKIEEYLKSVNDSVSLNSPVSDSEDADELQNFISSSINSLKTESELSEMQQDVRSLFDLVELTDREKLIILLRNGFINGRIWLLNECEKIFGITRERIRQIEETAYSKFRICKNIKHFAIYMDNPSIVLESLNIAISEIYECGMRSVSTTRMSEILQGVKEKKQNYNVEGGEKMKKSKYNSISNLIDYLNCPKGKEYIVFDIVNAQKTFEQDIIYKKCGKDLNGENSQLLNSSEKNIFFGRLLNRIKKMFSVLIKIDNQEEYNLTLNKLKNSFQEKNKTLDMPVAINSSVETYASKEFLKNEKKKHNGFNLIEFFHSQYSYEELTKALNIMAYMDRRMIYKACGPELNGIRESADSYSENNVIVMIRPQLIKLFGQERYSRAVNGEISVVSENTNENTKNDVTSTQTEILNKSNQSPSNKNLTMLDKDKKTDDNSKIESRVKRKITNLLLYFGYEYSFGELDSVIKMLNVEYQEIIYKKCGSLLDGDNGLRLSKDETKKFGPVIMRALKQKLMKIYGFQRMEIAEQKYQKIIENSEDSSLKVEPKSSKELTILEEKEEQIPQTSLVMEIPGVLFKDDQKLDVKDYTKLKELLNNIQLKELSKLGFEQEEILICSLLHGFKDKSFTIKQIAEFLQINESDIKEIAKKAIKKYQEIINNQLNEYILKLSNI